LRKIDATTKSRKSPFLRTTYREAGVELVVENGGETSTAISRIIAAEKAKRIVAWLARDFPREHESCPIGSDRALDNALITAPEARDPELLKKLEAIAGRVLAR
jgi:hypothetical protein